MGVDITTYRAAIGVFYSATHRSLSLPKLTMRFNFSLKLCCALSTFALLALGGFLKHDKFTFYKIILLMICMEVMLISNIFNETDLQLMMDGTILKIVEIHKHLGVYLSSNNKWSKHIDSIIASASKQISFMRKIKYKFSKQTLNTLYCTYIRPLFEYASEVWDGCSQTDANRLEQAQLNAARIVTGLPVFASTNSLYQETG